MLSSVEMYFLVDRCTLLFRDIHFSVEMKSMVYIKHKSERMGEILNPCHNFEIFKALVFPEWCLCRGHLVVPGYKCWKEFKKAFRTS